MPPIKIDANTWRRAFTRPLWNGPPLSGKTTGTLTLPRPTHLVAVPGESGYSSVQPADDYHIWAWEFDPNQPLIKWAELYKELVETVDSIIAGKHGPAHSVVIDGGTQLYDLIMRVEGWTPALVDDDKKGPRQYMKYHDRFQNLLARWIGSNVPVFGMTTFDGKEPVEGSSDKQATELFPQLPGRMAKDVVKMFGLILHCERDQQGYWWRVRPAGRYQGCGLHLPQHIAAKFPDRLPQDWRKVEALLGEAA